MNIKIPLLHTLKNNGGWAQDKPTLKKAMQAHVGGQVGDGAFDDALDFLIEKGWAGTRISDLTGDTLYFITETGKTRAAQ